MINTVKTYTYMNYCIAILKMFVPLNDIPMCVNDIKILHFVTAKRRITIRFSYNFCPVSEGWVGIWTNKKC